MFSGDLVEFGATPYTRRRLPRGLAGHARCHRGAGPAASSCPDAAPRSRIPSRVQRRHRGHARLRHRDVRRGQARRARGQGPAHRVSRDLRGAEAALRRLGDLRSLPAVRRVARLRRGHASIRTRASGRPSATRRCGRRSKARRASRASRRHPHSPAMAFTHPVYEYRRAPEHDGGAVAASGDRGGRGAGGACTAIDLAQRGLPVLVLDDDDTVSVGLARDLLLASARSRSSTASDCGEADREQGRGLEGRQGLPGRQLAYQFDLLPEAGHHRPAFVNLQQYYFEAAPGGACARRCRVSRSAGGTRSWPWRRATTCARVSVDTEDGRVRAHVRLARGVRRRAQPRAPHARPRLRGTGLSRSLPHRRHPHGVRLSRRAALLVQSAVPSGTLGAAASPARRHVARRLPARVGRRSRGREATRAHRAAPARDAGRRRAVHARVGERVHVPVPAHAEVPSRPPALRGRCGAPREPVRRARRQQRRAGCRQPRAGSSALVIARPCARCVARYLRQRARGRGRREPAQLPRARPTSSRPRAPSRARSAMRCSRSRAGIRSRARSSTADACRCPRCSRTRRSTRPTSDASPARWCRARWRRMRRSTVRAARGCSITCVAISSLLVFGDGVERRDGPHACGRRHSLHGAAAWAAAGATPCAIVDGLVASALRWRGRARAISSGPTSTCARDGARSIARRGSGDRRAPRCASCDVTA